MNHFRWESISSSLMIQQTLQWAVVASTIFHLVVVLGISFTLPEQTKKSEFTSPLEITLVTDFSETAPENTKTYAQANSLGSEDKAATDSNIIIPNSAQIRPQTTQHQSESSKSIISLAERKSNLISSSQNRNLISNQPELSQELPPENINLQYLNWKSKPREKYVDTRSKENHYVGYIEKWRLMVERVGNLNYPEAAKQQRLEGSLVLDVEVNSDGSVNKIKVLKSSGHKILDDAAERTVVIAAPFDRFPDSIKAEVDTLHIVRSWYFGSNEMASKTINIK